MSLSRLMRSLVTERAAAMDSVEPEAGTVSRSAGGGSLPASPQTSGRSKFALHLMREALGRMVVRAGWIGGLGVSLLVLAVVSSYFTERYFEERRTELAAERARLLRSEGQQVPAIDDRERVKVFYDRFPSITELPARLRRLDELATRQGLSLKRTDYRSGNVGGTPLQAVSLSIPVEGDFTAIYSWLAAVLSDMPEATLESLNVKRADSDTTVVEAEARLQLYLRGGK